MTTIVEKVSYKEDVTGKRKENLISNEAHQIHPTYNVIIPHHAPFFAESVIVEHQGVLLAPNRDYRFEDLETKATEKTGKSVYVAIVINRENLMGEVRVTYQTYGVGDHSRALLKYINEIMMDNRDTEWANVINKPKGYPPIFHTHHASELVGIEPIVIALQEIAMAVNALRIKKAGELWSALFKIDSGLGRRIDRLELTLAGIRNIEDTIAQIRNQSDAAIEDIKRSVKAMKDTLELDKKLRDLDDSVKAWVLRTLAEKDYLPRSEFNAYKGVTDEHLAEIDRLLAARLDRDALNTLLLNYVTKSELGETLKRYVTQDAIVALRADMANKVDIPVFEAALASLSRELPWERVTNTPPIFQYRGEMGANTVSTLVNLMKEGIGCWGVKSKSTTLARTLGLPPIDITEGVLNIYPADMTGNSKVEFYDLTSKRMFIGSCKSATQPEVMSGQWKEILTTSSLNDRLLSLSTDWSKITGIPQTAIRWPRWDEITGKPEFGGGNWESLAGVPQTASRWPLWNEVGDKPAHFPTNWNNIEGKPQTASRWPSFEEVTGKPNNYPTRWDMISGKPDFATMFTPPPEDPRNMKNRGFIKLTRENRCIEWFHRTWMGWHYTNSLNAADRKLVGLPKEICVDGEKPFVFHVMPTKEPNQDLASWSSIKYVCFLYGLSGEGSFVAVKPEFGGELVWNKLDQSLTIQQIAEQLNLDWGKVIGKPDWAKHMNGISWSSIFGKPTDYPTTWDMVKGKPDNLGVEPTWNAVRDKPTSFPTTWENISGKPATATRHPTWDEVQNKPNNFPVSWSSVTDKPIKFPSRWDLVEGIPGNIMMDHGAYRNARHGNHIRNYFSESRVGCSFIFIPFNEIKDFGIPENRGDHASVMAQVGKTRTDHGAGFYCLLRYLDTGRLYYGELVTPVTESSTVDWRLIDSRLEDASAGAGSLIPVTELAKRIEHTGFARIKWYDGFGSISRIQYPKNMGHRREFTLFMKRDKKEKHFLFSDISNNIYQAIATENDNVEWTRVETIRKQYDNKIGSIKFMKPDRHQKDGGTWVRALEDIDGDWLPISARGDNLNESIAVGDGKRLRDKGVNFVYYPDFRRLVGDRLPVMTSSDPNMVIYIFVGRIYGFDG